MVTSRAYTIACDDGEEEISRNSWPMSTPRREVLGSVGQVGDARMLLMAAL
jgi:cell division protein ZapA